MNYKQLKAKIKEEQKNRASSIRILKTARKPSVYQSNPSMYDGLGYLETHQYDVRHVHIAYCMFFNKTEYKAIERKCHEKPNAAYLKKLKAKWEKELEVVEDETVHTSA